MTHTATSAFKQLMLFAAKDCAEGGEIRPAKQMLRCPFCQALVLLGPPVAWEGGYNQSGACGCGWRGERSTRC